MGTEIFVLVTAAFFVLFLALVPKLFRSELNAATMEVWALLVEVTAMARLNPNFLKKPPLIATLESFISRR